MKVRPRLAGIACAVMALGALAGCGTSSSGTGTTGGGGSPNSIPKSGLGLTQPTHPAGARITGGTVYFTEGSDAVPNYIFPIYSPRYCSTTNSNQMISAMFRPLYWYGDDFRPTVDYNKSIGQKPQFSNGDRTVTVKLNSYKWADGESVTARDLVFYMNLLKADPATEWCGYVPGYFPDNVTSYSAPNAQTFVMHFNKAYDPEWVLYSELSQITPLPLAWDRTSLSQPAPSADNGHLPDTTKSGAGAVFKFLDSQGKNTNDWGSSPLWQVVDGPFKVQSFTTDGRLTMVPNPKYSGSPKPSIAKMVELPFTSEAAIYNQIKSGGPSALTIASLPAQYAPQASGLEAEGYLDNKASSYSFNYFPLNFNSSASTQPGGEPIRFVFRQLYFRQAFQHLVDQDGWVSAFLNHTANPTYSPIPPSPPSPLVSTSATGANPYPFSVTAAKQLLSSHGWKVVPGGSSTCAKPGNGPAQCGAGISAGEGISFNIDYQSGVTVVQNEMNDLAAQAKKVGITVNLTTHPFDSVISTAVACKPSQAICKWTAQNWGAGWIYGPSYLPTGEQLYDPGAVANYGSYSNPATTALITKTITGPLSQEQQALTTYAENVSHELPVVFGPTSVGIYGGYAGTMVSKKLGGFAANALGNITPEDWYFTR